MNVNKINEYIQKEYTKQLEVILTNVSIHYNLNKKEVFEAFLYKNTTSKMYKNKKKNIDKQYICMARKQSGDQCSRSKKYGDFCGKHSKHKNTCPLNEKVCNCKPKGIGRIDNSNIEVLTKQLGSSNHIIVKPEIINDTQYNIEPNTQILFDTNIKNPKVIGKKLSENQIFFLSENNNDDIETPSILLTSCKEDSHEVIHTEEVNITITNLLNKHSNSNIEADYNEFNIITGDTDHTLTNIFAGYNKHENIDMVDDVNTELGLY